MISAELKNILDDITKQGKFRFLENATKELIISFENDNKVSIAAILFFASLKVSLRIFNCINLHLLST